MRFDELNKDNYILFAIKFYNNPHAVTKADFDEDLKRIKYIKRLLKRYVKTGVIRTNLVLNHLTVLFNVFDDAAIPLMIYNFDEDLWPSLKSFLLFLDRIPEYPQDILSLVEEDYICTKELESI